jgi:hypothetical protein
MSGNEVIILIPERRSSQIFQKLRMHLTILGARRVICRKFHIED